ncbi:MAG: amidohydrolase family protein [Acidobacteriota bacterium]
MMTRALHLSIGAALLALVASTVGAETLAFHGGTIHPVSQPPIEDGVVLVEDGSITAVGSAADVTLPSGATVVDLDGRHLYPGFVSAISVTGLAEISSVRGTRDDREIGNNNAHLRAETAWHADSLRLEPAYSGGVLTTHTVQAGDLIFGTSAVMRMSGWNRRDMTVAAPVGMHMAFPNVAGGDDEDDAAGEARDQALEALEEIFEETRAYAKAKAAGSPGLAVDPRLDAMIPVIEGELPLHIHTRPKAQLEAALDWVEEQGLVESTVVVVGPDARYVTDRLAELDIPVVLAGVLEEPERNWEPYDTGYTTAKVLHEAGVRFAIANRGDDDASWNERNLPFHAAMAAAFGLPKDIALRSVTLSAAEVLGVEDKLGSIDVGKEANLFVASGDPLEILTRIEQVFIDGREIDLTAGHQYQLYERYDNRPRPEGLDSVE